MVHQTRILCPTCKAAFRIVLDGLQFGCPECGSRFELIKMKDGWGWTPARQGPAWHTQPIYLLNKHRSTLIGRAQPSNGNIGKARTRRMLRRQRRRHPRVLFSAITLTVVCILVYAGLPSGIKLGIAASISSASLPLYEPETGQLAVNTGSPEGERTQTETVTPTVTPTIRPTAPPAPSLTQPFQPTYTATPTATSIPRKLAIATVWQATLDQAVARSYKIQTQNAEQYAATRTALPPVLTQNAIERAALATETAP